MPGCSGFASSLMLCHLHMPRLASPVTHSNMHASPLRSFQHTRLTSSLIPTCTPRLFAHFNMHARLASSLIPTCMHTSPCCSFQHTSTYYHYFIYNNSFIL